MSTNDKIALMRRFKAVLVAEQDKRSERKLWVEGRGPEWMLAEREAMWRVVDEQVRMRSHDGVGVPISAIERVENMAAGHVDYTDKYALHCAEIVVGERDRDGGLMPLEAQR